MKTLRSYKTAHVCCCYRYLVLSELHSLSDSRSPLEMKFLVFTIALLVTVTTVHGNPKRVKCYVCQWSSLSGYTSPFTQADCTSSQLSSRPRAYVQECDNGCAISVLKISGTIVGESRGCGTASSYISKTRLCTGDDCNKDWTSKSAMTASFTRTKCRQASGGPYVVNFTDIYLNVSRVATNCSLGNDPEKHQYCSISRTRKDKLSGMMFGSYEDVYALSCFSVLKTQFTGQEYVSETKNCMNDFCNRKLDDGAVDPTTTVAPSTTTEAGTSLRPVVITTILMTFVASLV